MGGQLLVAEIDPVFSKASCWEGMVDHYLSLLREKVDPTSRVLDAACGRGGIFSRSNLNETGLRKVVVGIDAGRESNPHVDVQIVGNLERLPFDNESFDVIVCEWAAEHLERPSLVFREFARVLAIDSGVLVLITPNIRNPLVFLGRIVPSRAKDWVLKMLLHVEDNDLFPVYLRCNSVSAIEGIAAAVGLERNSVSLFSNPDYFRFNRVLLRVLVRLERALSCVPWLASLRIYIVASYSKRTAHG